MHKIWGVAAAGLIIFIMLFSVSTASADSSYETKVVVYNNYTTKMWVNFKCYDQQPWEDNKCLSFNTGYSEPIKAGDKKDWSKTMSNTTAKCNKIYINYGRSDRSCSDSACQKAGSFSFPEITVGVSKVTGPLKLNIVNQGGDFVMQQGY
jgi:hypothetical protein